MSSDAILWNFFPATLEANGEQALEGERTRGRTPARGGGPGGAGEGRMTRRPFLRGRRGSPHAAGRGVGGWRDHAAAAWSAGKVAVGVGLGFLVVTQLLMPRGQPGAGEAPRTLAAVDLAAPSGPLRRGGGAVDPGGLLAPAVDPGLWELGGVPPRDPAGSLDPRERTIFYLRIQKTGSNSFQQRILPPSRPGAVSPCDNASDRSLCGYGLRISAAVKRALGEAGLERKVANACACDFYLKVERIRHLTGHANDVSTCGSGRRRTGD